MSAKLQILSGKRQGTVFDLPDTDVDIGNRKSAKLSIRDPWISYNHAKITTQDGKFFIEDLGSSNGTWINGKKITRQELRSNVLIYLGKTKVKFIVGDEGDIAAEDLGAKPEETPWWDRVLEDRENRGGAGGARLRRLESELREERRMRQALEKFLGLPRGASVGDAARAGELEARVKELEAKLAAAGGGADPQAIDEAVAAERARGEKLRREQMTTIVELEGKLGHSESKVVELERRLKEKSEQVKKEVSRAKERMQEELENLRQQLDEARQNATQFASGGDEALAAARQHAERLERELDEARAGLKNAEERVEALEQELAEARATKPRDGERDETLKSQLWAAVEEATKWKEEASRLGEELEAAKAEAERWKEEHAQVVQEIDEISMEQIDVEEELNERIRELEGLLRQHGLDVPQPSGDAAEGGRA